MKQGSKKDPQPNPEYIQKKIELIEQGLPIDISEVELQNLEETLRGARSFYIDILTNLESKKNAGEDIEHHLVEESKNLAGIEVALRKIDDFRKDHSNIIK